MSNHLILDEVTYEHKLNDIKFTFIELKKFDLAVDELKTLIEKWVFFIKNAEDLAVIPENVDDEGLLEAYKDADRHSWKKEDLIAYDNFFIAQQDAIGRVELAEERGERKGILKVINKCIKKGMSIEDIADITDLTVEEIKSLIKDNL